MKHSKLKKNLFGLLLFCGLCLPVTINAKEIELKSPNGEIKLMLSITDKINYNILYNNESLLTNCGLQMSLADEVLGESPRIQSIKREQIATSIKPSIPLKFSTVENKYNKLLIKFKNNYSVEFRLFNDGMAYRFITNIKDSIIVKDENLTIGFPENYLAHMQQPKSFKTAYEEQYTHVDTKQFVNEERKMCVLPVLLDTKRGYKILMSETDLSDYPCMFLKGTAKNEMTSVFPNVPLAFGDDGDRSVKLLKEADYIAKTSGKRNFPWRYFVIAKNDGELIENTMSLKLAGQSKIDDTSWIQPGQVSWEWWNGASPYGQDVNFVTGCNLDTYKYYIDFASKFGIKYIIMDEGWAKSTRNPYIPNPDVDLPELIRYGKEKNVKIVLWLTWLAVENNFDLFKTFADWGVAGIKIDFMDRSDQWMVNYYERVAKEAAKYKLFVDFHGSFKPAGLEYKYPNILSYEGVRGLEQGAGCFPDNNIFYPFIRNAVGAMDFTPGAMINMQPDVYCAQRPNNAGKGTRANQMAMFVIYESGLQMLADNPTLYYKNEECTKFITQVPVTWDETKAIDAQAGEYLIVAKRKGNKWYIGGMTNGNERLININLSFLTKDNEYKMTCFEDGINAGTQAMDYRKIQSVVKNGDNLTVKMVKNGGFAAIIE